MYVVQGNQFYLATGLRVPEYINASATGIKTLACNRLPAAAEVLGVHLLDVLVVTLEHVVLEAGSWGLEHVAEVVKVFCVLGGEVAVKDLAVLRVGVAELGEVDTVADSLTAIVGQCDVVRIVDGSPVIL